MSTSRPLLTQREAAAACGVSRTTIRRRREEGAFPNAVQEGRRGWVIPVEDLLAAGFRLHAPAPPDPAPAGTDDGGEGDQEQEDVIVLRMALERERLEHRLALAEERHGRELAEERARGLRARVEAQERHISSLEESLRALLPVPERAAVEASGGVFGPAQYGQGGQPSAVDSAGVPRPSAGEAGSGAEMVGHRRWWGGRGS
ncbi:helix-turn-helix domain-containing protein [Streptomyces fradiae]|uniref:helix-turn-helix domain-containing protein n=1 Tax=Streptomyces fradiae TaxID=1906 RepID=UPI0033FAF0F9